MTVYLCDRSPTGHGSFPYSGGRCSWCSEPMAKHTPQWTCGACGFVTHYIAWHVDGYRCPRCGEGIEE